MTEEEIINHPHFQQKLEEIAQQGKLNIQEVQKEAALYIEELFTETQKITSLFTLRGFQYLLSRSYGNKIDVVPEEIRRLMKLMHRHPVAFLMTHKTYIDTAVLIVTLAQYGMPIPYMFGGINMAFTGLKQLGKRIGMIYIRRSFKDNPVYKASLRHFLSQLIDSGQHFTWAIEGTRSRTGKIVWPKMGILKYIMEGEQASSREIKYVPVSIVYDLIPDVKLMTEQSKGKSKSPESLAWMINYILKMGEDFGRVAIRFDEPVDAKGYHSAIIPDQEENSYLDKNTLPRFAFELVYRANQINPVTTVSLVCNVLLSHFALSKKEIEGYVSQLMHFIEKRKPNVLLDRGKPIGKSVQAALNLLFKANIVQKTQSSLDARFFIAPSEYLPANYYANMAAVHLYHRAFIELALVKTMASNDENRFIHFWEEIMALRDLFKFEFFYTNKAQFSDEIEEELALFTPKWKAMLKNPKGDIRTVLNNQPIFVAEALLLNYLEAYRVVLQTLLHWDSTNKFTDNAFLDACMFTGKEMHWHGHIRRLDNVSIPFLTNGLRLAKNRQLIGENGIDYEKINATDAILSDLVERLNALRDLEQPQLKPKALEVPLEMEVVPGSGLESLSESLVGEEGNHVAAFFDLDRTLINDFSAKQFVQSRVLSGKVTFSEVFTQLSAFLSYALGTSDFAQMAAMGARGVKGIKEQEFIDLGEEVYLDHLAEAIYPESRALVASHLAKGHTVVIVSAATTYQVNSVARDLGIESVLSTEMEVKDGKFTGKVIHSCWGEGKAEAARKFAKTHDIDLSKSYFYTDSHEDLPLLEIVGHPQAVNPDNKLSQLAFEQSWPIHRFEDTNSTTFMNSLRTALALSSIYPAVLTGIASGVRSFSWRKGVNSTIASLGDFGARMAGLEMMVKGKRNLYDHRPAVFIFNHQSSADMIILAKLLREDVQAIGKKELRNHPFGPIFKAMGLIFVDRSNREKAIEAMQPAVEALKTGTSIAIAPEGTRSADRTLGKFKKGAFHLAMQANVPIVPVVIKNAHDAMPKGSSLVRPTNIEVVVLDPVDVSKWELKNLEVHIEDVRKLFLQELV
ncbi:acyltransferase [marine bacterium AO1-C]|nr:acyltransferase [marine bacterium AO1-C]